MGKLRLLMNLIYTIIIVILFAFHRSRLNVNQNDTSNQNLSFIPVLYNFRVTPPPSSNKTFALQQPFATLFDNLITVLWSVYGKNSKIQIGKLHSVHMFTSNNKLLILFSY